MLATGIASRKTQECSRDLEAEAAALSLARRRGKCGPSVDTKLANAWLGFYVALTKSSCRPAEAATQASTELETETSLSDVASSFSPGHPGLGCRLEEASVGDTLRDSFADASDEPSSSPQKGSRRSHRRRRTRGRGSRKGSSTCLEDRPEEEIAPIEEDEDLDGPFRAGMVDDARPKAGLLMEPLPIASPLRAVEFPTGMLTGTSPKAVHTPTFCEASARTPPRVAFGGSPVAHTLPSTSTACGISPYQGGYAAYHGSHMMLASPGSVCVGSPCPGQGFQAGPAPGFFNTTPVSPQWQPPLSPAPSAMPMYNDAMSNPNVMRSWLTGGMWTSDADLAMRLQAALPEAYED